MARHTEPTAAPTPAVRPQWSEVLRGLRAARGVTRDGWAAWLGYSTRTVQRWEAGTAVPDADAELAIVSLCRDKGLLRTYFEGPLRGLTVTAELLHHLLAEARLGAGQTRHETVPAGPAPARPSSPPTNLPVALTSFLGRERELADLQRLLDTARLLTLSGTGGVGKTRLALEAARAASGRYPDGVWLVELAALAVPAGPGPVPPHGGALLVPGDAPSRDRLGTTGPARWADAPALVAEAVAATLRVRAPPGQPLADALAAALQSKGVLLVLDNCEHLVDACARLAELLLRACPGVRVLATSREPLGIGGEALYRVPPLALPNIGQSRKRSPGHRVDTGDDAHDSSRPCAPAPSGRVEPVVPLEEGLAAIAAAPAVRLFVDRSVAVLPSFALTEQNAAAVTQICSRLDGIPLALELAAARMRVLSPEQIAHRLDDRFRLLTGGSRTAQPRQQTLRAALDWSWDLLTEPERVLFARLSVFAGSFTLDAAEAVCSVETPRPLLPSDGVLDLLTQLVDKSLVVRQERDMSRPEGAARYRLLEIMREYAREKLSLRDAGHVRPRHRDWYLVLAERADSQMLGPEQHVWLERLEEEHDNLRAALHWSLDQGAAEAGLRLARALGHFWSTRGYLREGRQWLEVMLAAGRDLPPSLRMSALGVASGIVGQQGDLIGSRALLEEGLILSRAEGDKRNTAALLGRLGYIDMSLGDHARASASLEEALAIRQELGDREGLASSLFYLGLVSRLRGDFARAGAALTECLALAREQDNTMGIALALGGLANLAVHQGDLDRGRALHEQSLPLYRELHDQPGTIIALNNLGIIALQQDDERASALLSESLARARALGQRPSVAVALRALGYLALRQQDSATARALLEESLALGRALGTRGQVIDCLAGLAGVALAEGQAVRAARLCGAVDALSEAMGEALDPLTRAVSQRTLTGAGGQLGQTAAQAAWTAGRELSLEHASSEALTAATPGN
jgi:predicted ATPase/DNA-binding transcriptional regulator YiaG